MKSLFDVEGKLVSNDTGQPFEFAVSQNMADNNRRYHAIGRLADQYVYDCMENKLGLQKINIPVHETENIFI